MAAVARITVVTAGHLSTCPRMVKAADALHGAGYAVRVVSTNHTPWAARVDADVRRTRTWDWSPVDLSRAGAPVRHFVSGARRRAARAVAGAFGTDVPAGLAFRAFSRAHDELAAAAAAVPADLVYGGTSGALSVVSEAARRLNVPYGLDLEDLHAEEDASPEGGLERTLAASVERAVLPRAAFLTTSSPLIAVAYQASYGLMPTVVHNTFPLPATAPPIDVVAAPLRLCWFSQTIGAGRGLEDAVRAVGEADIDAVLALRGYPASDYVASLEALSRRVAPRLRVQIDQPCGPDELVEACRPFHVGLSGQEPTSESRRRCLENKIFTYLLAGLPVVLSATEAHRAIAAELGNAAVVYPFGETATLARQLREWATVPAALAAARRAAWHAATTRWHWEHDADRGQLLSTIEAALARHA